MEMKHVYNATYKIKGKTETFVGTLDKVVDRYLNRLFQDDSYDKFNMVRYEVLNLAYMEKNNSVFCLDDSYYDNMNQSELDNLFRYLDNEILDKKIINLLKKNGCNCELWY